MNSGSSWKAEAVRSGNPGRFTVNSSINAVPVHERFGFVPSGPSVETDGVGVQPMLLVEAKAKRPTRRFRRACLRYASAGRMSQAPLVGGPYGICQRYAGIALTRHVLQLTS